jgi:hypothetical protein
VKVVIEDNLTKVENANMMNECACPCVDEVSDKGQPETLAHTLHLLAGRAHQIEVDRDLAIADAARWKAEADQVMDDYRRDLNCWQNYEVEYLEELRKLKVDRRALSWAVLLLPVLMFLGSLAAKFFLF